MILAKLINPNTIKAVGKINICVRDEFGNIKREMDINNTVTTLGKEHIADRMATTPSLNPMCSMAIGTGTPSATALGTEVYRKGFKSKTVSGAVVTYQAYWDINDRIAITVTEAGIFNAPNLGGTMLNSGTVSPSIVKGLNDVLDITWTLTIA